MSELLALSSVERVLADALGLRDASLVIHRHGTLVEFKTETLQARLSRCVDDGHRGWQIGPFDGHHCHLNLALVDRIQFDAAPVPCQGGRLNYTLWFLVARDCGNPHRPDGYFSITLNAPYLADGKPRLDLIQDMYAIHARHGRCAGVHASERFIAGSEALLVESGRQPLVGGNTIPRY